MILTKQLNNDNELTLVDINNTTNEKPDWNFNPEKFNMMVKFSTDIISLLDESGTVLYESPSVKRILGYEPEELIGKNAFALVHPEDLEEVLQVFKEGFENPGVHKKVTYRYRHSNGNYIYLESVGTNFLDNPAVNGIVINTRDVTDEVNYENKLNEMITEKEIILKEIHHRVKNNLQIISSLLNIQASSVSNLHLKKLLNVSRNRVRSMALIHQLLYHRPDVSKIDIQDYLYSLSSLACSVFDTEKIKTAVSVLAKDVFMSAETASPFGLLINELLTSSLNSAYHDSTRRKIEIILKGVQDGEYLLTYRDNNMDSTIEPDCFKKDSFGLSLMDTLIEQLDGNITRVPSFGNYYEISFKDQVYTERFTNKKLL